MMELFKRLYQGDMSAREEIIENNLGLVYTIAKKYTNHIDYEVAVQEGSIGLIKAVDTYDISRNIKFSTYAYKCIEVTIKTYIRDKDERLPFKLRREDYILTTKISKVITKLTDKYNRKPTLLEISKELKTKESRLSELLSITNSISIYEELPFNENIDSRIYIYDTIKDNSCNETTLVNEIDLHMALSKLSSIEKYVIEKRYFDSVTQSNIAKNLSIAQSKVCRIEKKALNNLKILLKEVV